MSFKWTTLQLQSIMGSIDLFTFEYYGLRGLCYANTRLNFIATGILVIVC